MSGCYEYAMATKEYANLEAETTRELCQALGRTRPLLKTAKDALELVRWFIDHGKSRQGVLNVQLRSALRSLFTGQRRM